MSSDDEALKLAIALSLSEAHVHPSTSKGDPIVISSDDDDPPPARADLQRKAPPQSNSMTDSVPSVSASTTASAPVNTFLAERAQLEAARLARLKRSRESSPKVKTKPVLDDPFVSLDESEAQEPPPKRFKYNAVSNSPADTASSAPVRYSGSRTQPKASGLHVETAAENELFWMSELRQNGNMYAERTKDTRPVFRLNEILGNKSELVFIILSSFVTQLSWIYSILPEDVPVLLFTQPDKDSSTRVHNVLPNWVKVMPELKGGRGCMHMKFMMLFYKSGRLRIVITTANLVDYDWRDIENTVWLQDIPSRPKVIPLDPIVDDFPAQFERVLDALCAREGLRALREDHPGIPLRHVRDLRCGWDFSKVHAQLVPSLAGRHEGWSAVLRVGHTRLMRVVRIIGARADGLEVKRGKRKGSTIGNRDRQVTERQLQLECQGSSIGSYTPAWIDEFVGSARGASPEALLDEGKTKRTKNMDAKFARDGWTPWSHLKILFPSLRTVRASQLGEDGAGTMWCQRRQWNGPKFPRQLFHDSNSKRGPILIHTKMILATLTDASSGSTQSRTNSKSHVNHSSHFSDRSATEPSSESDPEVQEVDPERDASVVGWLYVGSHNFTPSAWGTLSGTRFMPIMNITNYELGIVLPLKDLKQADELTCWDRPPRKYDGKDEPWIQPNL